MSMRGARFHVMAQPLIGGELFHGVDDRRTALDQLRTGFAALAIDLVNAPANVIAALKPTMDAFAAFYASETTSAIAPWLTEWDVFTIWRERLTALRIAARASGILLTGPEPGPLPKTLWERGEDGTGTGVDRAMVFGRHVFKWGLAALGIFGAWKAIKHLRRDVSDLESHRVVLAQEAPSDEDAAMYDPDCPYCEREAVE